MSEYIHKSHNVTVLLYHLVFPAKYRRAVFDEGVDQDMTREIFKRCPHVKRLLWGGEFWSDGYFASSVGKHGDEAMIGEYVRNQGGNYQVLHSDHQLALF